jgi:hypothetical protein
LEDYNAKLNEQAAATTERDALAMMRTQRAENARMAGRQRALFAAAGVRMDTGTPLMTQVQTAQQAELRVAETRRQGEVTAQKLRTQAAIDRFGGQSAHNAGVLGAIGAGIGTVAKTASGMASGYASGAFKDSVLDFSTKKP